MSGLLLPPLLGNDNATGLFDDEFTIHFGLNNSKDEIIEMLMKLEKKHRK